MLILGVELHDTGILSLFQHIFVCLQYRCFYLGLLITCSGSLLGLGQTALNGLEVFQLQLCINDFLVADGIDSTIHMGDIIILETAQYMDNRICLTDVSQELVSQSFALGSTFYQTRYIYNLAGGGNDASRMNQLCQFGESFIGNGNDTHIGFDCTEREIGCLCLGTAQTVEQSGFTHIGQSYNTTF